MLKLSLPQCKYINQYLASRSSADIQLLRVFPASNAAKEVTESMAMVNALIMIPNDKKRIIICVGDGKKPRTAVCCAFFTKNRCISIDPEMDFMPPEEVVLQRVEWYKNKIEEMEFAFDEEIIIIHCHSHAKISESLKHIRASKKHVISMPCCNADDISNPDISYEDNDVWSPHKTINIYLNR